MCMNSDFIDQLYTDMNESVREAIDKTVNAIVAARKREENVVVVTGSGPNIHEGVTTLIAELIRIGVINGVSTSSAVVAHEMAGSLDRVKRVHGARLGLRTEILPKDGLFEVTLLDDKTIDQLKDEMILDSDLISKAMEIPGEVIVKAAGNIAYPMGLRTERIALEIEALAQESGYPFELVAGLGADPHTMIGAGSLYGVPVLVTVPQLVGGGRVGLCIGDSISLKRRSSILAKMLSEASVIIESGVALTQEIHDGPYETHTGHGMWSAWEGIKTYSLHGKTLVRIDLDANLETVCNIERKGGTVQQSVNHGLPKTKTLKIPFRMEMSGFARLESSVPIVGDIGAVWPVIAAQVVEKLGMNLSFMSYPQESQLGKEMRDWIVQNVGILNRSLIHKRLTENTVQRFKQLTGGKV